MLYIMLNSGAWSALEPVAEMIILQFVQISFNDVTHIPFVCAFSAAIFDIFVTFTLAPLDMSFRELHKVEVINNFMKMKRI